MAQSPDLSPEEPFRLQALRRLNLVETPLEERFDRVTRQLKRFLQVDIAAIALVESDRQFFKSIQGLECSGTSRDDSFCGHTILSEEMMIVPDAREDVRFHDNPLVIGEPGIVFYAALPLYSPDGLAVGSICVIHRDIMEFTEDDVQTLRDFAAFAESELQAASANAVQASLLENVTTEQRRSLIDPLTRLWNRDGILALVEELAQKNESATCGAALVMVDLDRFKEVNDTFGHAAGDTVLRSAARRMLAALRESDVIGRLGGDEFLLILSPCESPNVGAEVVDRVRKKLSEHPIQTDTTSIEVTASFGVSFVEPGNRQPVASLLEKADQAMYESKRGGRESVQPSSAK